MIPIYNSENELHTLSIQRDVSEEEKSRKRKKNNL
jgi:hypothetical protein